MDIFKKLKELNLPEGKYVVIGSGLLAALGLREANDLDLLVSADLLAGLIKSGRYIKKDGGNNLSSEDGLIDISSGLKLDKYTTTVLEAISGAKMINGFPFQSISETIKFKTALGREKDFKDIKMLENYIKNNGEI